MAHGPTRAIVETTTKIHEALDFPSYKSKCDHLEWENPGCTIEDALVVLFCV